MNIRTASKEELIKEYQDYKTYAAQSREEVRREEYYHKATRIMDELRKRWDRDLDF